MTTTKETHSKHFLTEIEHNFNYVKIYHDDVRTLRVISCVSMNPLDEFILKNVHITFSDDFTVLNIKGEKMLFNYYDNFHGHQYNSESEVMRRTIDNPPVESVKWKTYTPNSLMKLFGRKEYRYLDGWVELQNTVPYEAKITNWAIIHK